ncbi:hypothetical protein BC829DRAFT_399506 [Chytridium lagenaria]|nr:hypothetical protein BC829DRAFT_399506 [Chytridium lagenaria]
MARPFLFENLLPKWNPVTNCFEDVLTPEVSQPSASPVIDDPLRPSPYKDLGREFRNGASEKQIDDDFQVQQAGALQSQSNFLSTLNFGSTRFLTKPSNLDRGASFRPPGNELMNHPALNGRPSPGSSLSQACTPEPFNWNSVFEARTMPTSIQSTYTPIKGATALTTIESPIFDEAVEDIDEASASKPSRSVEPLTFASTERDLGSPQRFTSEGL